MKMYRIPNTDLDVTRLAYGIMGLGGSWDKSPLTADVIDAGVEAIETAVDVGINFLDLADIYRHTKSEQVVGEALRRNPGLRDKLVLQAKCGIILADGDNPPHFNFSYEHLVTALEGVLKRLGTDHVELMLLHRPDPLVEPEEVARAFDELESSGKVRYFGVSNQNPWSIDLLKRYVRQPMVVNQLELNVVHNHLIDDLVYANIDGGQYVGASGTLDYCRLHDIMIQAWAPVMRGKIFNPPDDAPPNIRAVCKEIAALAEKYQTTSEAIAIGWLLRHPAKIQPILGTATPQRIIDSAKADDVELTRVEWYRLLAAGNGKNVP